MPFLSNVRFPVAIMSLALAAASHAQQAPSFHYNYTPIPQIQWENMSPASLPPGRTRGSYWTDKNGDFWIYGGGTGSTDDQLSDMWKFNAGTATGAPEWTQVTPANTPGGRFGAVSWTDFNGDFWLFGGWDSDNYRNDLWKYNAGTATGTPNWAVVSTPSAPSARTGSPSWVDKNGDLWLFSGLSVTIGLHLQDMWKFTLGTNPGAPAWEQVMYSGTMPEGRYYSATWVDDNGDFWMQGGGTDIPGVQTWRFSAGTSPADPTWQQQFPAYAPQRRTNPSAWKDKNGDLWMYGGNGPANLIYQPLKYDRATGTPPNWTFMPTQTTVTRSMASISWTDRKGDFWMFGGVKSYPESGYHNDIFRLRVLQPVVPSPYVVSEDSQYVFSVPVDDPRGNSVVGVSVAPAHGTLTLQQGTTNTLVYTPNPDFTGADSFELSVSNGIHSPERSVRSINVTPVNDSPYISQVQFNPNPAVANQSVTVLPQAGDPDGDSLVFHYDYGDGTNDNTGVHTYANAGSYTVSVLASDGQQNTLTTANLVVVAGPLPPWDINGDGLINSMDYDDDGDGFPNNIEQMLGTLINDPASTPTGNPGPAFIPFAVSKPLVKGSVNKKTGGDKITLKAVLPTTETSLAGKFIAADIGGNLLLFNIDAQKGTKGIASGGSSLSCKIKKSKTGGPSILTLSFKLAGPLRAAMVQNGPVDGAGKPTRFTMDLYIAGNQYTAVQGVQFK